MIYLAGTYKKTLYSDLMGELLGKLCDLFGDNWQK